ncbi:uncharacterized protein ACO6RY_03037 [Pungitius sinensis]
MAAGWWRVAPRRESEEAENRRAARERHTGRGPGVTEQRHTDTRPAATPTPDSPRPAERRDEDTGRWSGPPIGRHPDSLRRTTTAAQLQPHNCSCTTRSICWLAVVVSTVSLLSENNT